MELKFTQILVGALGCSYFGSACSWKSSYKDYPQSGPRDSVSQVDRKSQKEINAQGFFEAKD